MFNFTKLMITLALLLVTQLSSCKKKPTVDINSLPVPGEKGSPEILPRPDPTPPGGDLPAKPQADIAAEEIHASVLAVLRSKHADAENKTWFDSHGLIEGDWIAQSPKNYWKKDASTLPAGYACVKGYAGCDPQFERMICTNDKDCVASRTQCLPLRASVHKEGDPVKSMCLGSGDTMLDDYYTAIVKAQRHLEISSLTFPNGRFRIALANALSVLSHRQTPPTIRMIVSSLDGFTANIKNPPGPVLETLLKEIAAVGGKPEALKINLAYLSDKRQSWNHAKIILADSNYVLQGGHNMLDPDYLKEQPIFDLSMHASGSVGLGVQAFVNTLWTKAGPMVSTLENNGLISPPAVLDAKVGESRIIGMGRLGSFGDLASDDGMSALIDASKKTIYFAQQDLFNDIFKLGPTPSHSLPNLISAVLRGVKIKVAQSSSTVFLGYGMVSPEKALELLLDAMTAEAAARKWVPEGNIPLREYLCSHIEYAPILFNAAVTKWPNGDAIGVHPKLIIADEVAFYMGSQNFYPSDLQEFGLMVSDRKVTAELMAAYWDRIWAESSQKKVPCK